MKNSVAILSSLFGKSPGIVYNKIHVIAKKSWIVRHLFGRYVSPVDRFIDNSSVKKIRFRGDHHHRHARVKRIINYFNLMKIDR